MPYADPEKRAAYHRAAQKRYRATHPEQIAAYAKAYRATPKGRETENRHHLKEYRNACRQRVADGPRKIAAPEAELAALYGYAKATGAPAT
jgi:ribosomal protein L35